MVTASTGPLAELRFGILGPLTVSRAGRPLPLGPLKQQQVLAVLLCRANSVTSLDLLTDTLWGAAPPRTARKNLQVYVACLRKLLGAGDRLIHRHGGYLLRATAEELDVLEFQDTVQRARLAGSPSARAAGLAAALRLWRGRALDGLTGAPALAAEADRLALRQLAAFEDWAEAELALGNAGTVLEPVCELAVQYPLRERLRQLEMTALYRRGRQAEALGVFDDLRQSLARELGLQPSAATEQLYRGMLGSPTTRSGAAGRPDRPLVLLPPDLPDFIGRAEPLRRIEDLLAAGGAPIAVVTGPVGIGKTSLALHAAHAAGRRFPDGRIFLGLRTEQGTGRPVRPLLLRLLRLVGQTGLDGCDFDELIDRWQQWLLDRRLLLVLDDAADSAVPRAVLPMGGASKVLATTRCRLPGLDYASRVELDPLTPAEAMLLLGRIVGPERCAAERRAAERIVQAVGLLPLAIRTAGDKLAMLRHLSLAEFADRLAEPAYLLAELGSAESVLRHRLAAGLSDLAEDERAALRRLGTLESPRFTVEQAAAVLAEAPGRSRRLVESLIESHAVTAPIGGAAADSYQLPVLLHCYLREVTVG